MENGKHKYNLGKLSVEKWYLNGLLHREDGPAVEWSNGVTDWWLNGNRYDKEDFHQCLKKKKLNEKLQATFKPKYKEKKNKI